MCGIFAYITNRSDFDIEKINNASDLIKHRGPDRTIVKTFQIKNYFIYTKFHRLAIVDSSEKGDQPFIYKKNLTSYILLCNGEIYNYKKLVQKYDLPTGMSDCHCILMLYIKYGIEKTLDLIENEFAFVIIEFNHYIGAVKIVASRDKFGIRPLFYNFKNDTLILASELKAIHPLMDNVSVFPPRQYMICRNLMNLNFNRYYDLNKFVYTKGFMIDNEDEIYQNVRDLLTKAVEDRLQSDDYIEIGCLLSGGLDSSLVSAIVANKFKQNNKKLKTFSIGFKNSEDLRYAKMVANYIGSDHHEVVISEETALNTIKDIIYVLETYDITTIRASIFQYLISKYIKENTKIKVVLNGDGADELFNGYKYNYYNKDPQLAHDDTIRLLSNIHYYDVLRSDRGISNNGLESRSPFLYTKLVEYILKIDSLLKIPIKNQRIEKYILRKSFENSNLLPNDVLFRQKEAFSDGVSNNKKQKYWFEIIKEYIDKLDIEDKIYTHLSPISRESLYYRNIFENLFYNNDNILDRYWMPNFIETNDPSAKTI